MMDESPKKKKTRGRSKGLNPNDHGKRFISWDRFGNLYGDWSVALGSYLGVLGRERVPIHYVTWHHVPNTLKYWLWEDAKGDFKIEEDIETKKWVLQKICKAWRTQKSLWYREFIKEKNPLQSPIPWEQGLCSQEDWDKFVANVSTEQYEEISKKAELSKSKDNNYTKLGRRSYRQAQPKWVADKSYLLFGIEDPDTADPAELSSANFMFGRSVVICGERVFLDDETRVQKDNLLELREMEKRGEFTPDGPKCYLNKVLGRKDHPGRTLGIGAHTGTTKSFGHSTRQSRGN